MNKALAYRKFFHSLIILIAMVSTINAQELYMPRNVKRAYDKQTRSMDGSPGKNYWQNHGKYVIHVIANPPERTVTGSETIKYFNNSPDTLRSPSIKLFQNIHKSIAPRDLEIDQEFLTNGIVIDSVWVSNKLIKLKSQASTLTNFSFRLPYRMAPHDSIQFRFKWHYDIATQGTKEGMVDSTTFFLGLFYPRIAVFDDHSGWDRIPYTALREFYSDFNDYDVTIHVPQHFVVWGTGTLQQPEKLLHPEVLEKYKTALHSNEIIHVVTQQDITAKKVTTANRINNWRFVSRNIPDVAFGISDHYVWDATSAIVDNNTGRKTAVHIAYNDTTSEYHHITRYSQHAINWFSQHYPGVSFPYPSLSAFQTFEEMEYPMMVKASAYADTTMAKFVMEHEIAHNYMPFYMGTNETRYGFMDEGWATTFELLIGIADRGRIDAEEFYKKFRVLGWKYNQSAGEDMPIINPTDNVVGDALGDNEYGKPSLGYLALKDMLGDNLFKKCLHDFMNKWQSKHPIPWDMFYTFNHASGQDLNWFWNNWFFSNHYIDLKLEQVKQTKRGCEIVIKNVGGIATPFDVVITYEDGALDTLHQTPLIWKPNLKRAIVKTSANKKIKEVYLEGRIFMDSDLNNNKWIVSN
jgi:hypothetical protein